MFKHPGITSELLTKEREAELDAMLLRTQNKSLEEPKEIGVSRELWLGVLCEMAEDLQLSPRFKAIRWLDTI